MLTLFEFVMEAAMLGQLVLVGVGGAVGSILRFLTSELTSRWYQAAFPLATFLINSLGCLVIGILIGVFEKTAVLPAELRPLLVTGFCGGFTTFSTFAAENLNLWQTNQIGIALASIAASVVAGLAAVWFGQWLVRQI